MSKAKIVSAYKMTCNSLVLEPQVQQFPGFVSNSSLDTVCRCHIFVCLSACLFICLFICWLENTPGFGFRGRLRHYILKMCVVGKRRSSSEDESGIIDETSIPKAKKMKVIFLSFVIQ